jgi:hypothetical protein
LKRFKSESEKFKSQGCSEGRWGNVGVKRAVADSSRMLRFLGRNSFKSFGSPLQLRFMSVKRGNWSEAEDAKIIEAVAVQGKGHKANWKTVAVALPGRTPGACQGRWNTYLDPNVDRSPWTPELDAKLLKMYNDPKTNSWTKRGAALAEGKIDINGKPMRRGGGDVCARYFFLVKKEAKQAEETQEPEEEEEEEEESKPKLRPRKRKETEPSKSTSSKRSKKGGE